MELTDIEIRFKLLIENNLDMLTLLAANGSVFYESPAIKLILGYQSGENTGKSFLELLHPEDLTMARKVFQDSIDNPAIPLFLSTRIKNKNGGYKQIEGFISNLLDVQGISAIVFNARDVTARNQADLTLKQFDHSLDDQEGIKVGELRNIFDRITDAFMAFDRNWRCIYVNKKACEIFDCDAASMLGKSVLHEINGNFNSHICQFYLQAFNEQRYIQVDEYSADNKVWLQAHIYPSPDGITVFFRDITVEKNAEKALQVAHQQIYYHISNTPLAVIEVDRKGQIIQWSKKAEEMFGWTKEEVLDRHFSDFDLVPDKDQEKVSGLVNELLQGRSLSNSGINLNNTKDRGLIYCEWYNSALKNENGEITSVLAFAQDITERLKADQETQNSKEQYTTLVNTVNGIVWEADAKTIAFEFVSKQAEAILGYPVRQWLEEPNFWQNHIHPDDKKWAIEYCKTCIRNKRSHEFEYRMINAKGKTVWLQDIIAVILDSAGNPVKLRGLMIDISHRKSIEKKLVSKERQLNVIYNSVVDPMWLIDIKEGYDFKFESVNNSFVKISGLKRKQTIGKSIEEVLPVGSHNLVREKYMEAITSKKIVEYIEVADLPAGLKTAEIKVVPLKNLKGQVTKILGIAHDITERKKAEDALQASKANVKTILDNTNVGYLLLDAQSKLITYNQPMEIFLKRDLGQIPGTKNNVIDYLPPERREIAQHIIQATLKGEEFDYEVSYPQPDGNKRWYNIHSVPISSFDTDEQHREVIGILVTFTDITKQKISEIYRETLTADLMHRIKDMEQFTYIVSHNLRSPVANIKGLSDILTNHPTTDQERSEMLRALWLSAVKLDEVIIDLNNILDVKKQAQEKKTVVQFPKLFNDVRYSIEHLIEKENVTIETHFSEGADRMPAIKGYLYSIFHNIISNSIKYRKASEDPHIIISSKKENDNIILTFKDNGMGIDLAKRGNELFGLYKRFYTNVEGKGMGLYMVKLQVEALNGRITVNSKPGEGTEFIIEFEPQ